MYYTRLYYIDVLLNNPVKLMHEVEKYISEHNNSICTIYVTEENDIEVYYNSDCDCKYTYGYNEYFYFNIIDCNNIYDKIIIQLNKIRNKYLENCKY